MLKFLCNWRI